MSSFLINLARRSAGLAVTPIRVPPASLFPPAIRAAALEGPEAAAFDSHLNGAPVQSESDPTIETTIAGPSPAIIQRHVARAEAPVVHGAMLPAHVFEAAPPVTAGDTSVQPAPPPSIALVPPVSVVVAHPVTGESVTVSQPPSAIGSTSASPPKQAASMTLLMAADKFLPPLDAVSRVIPAALPPTNIATLPATQERVQGDPRGPAGPPHIRPAVTEFAHAPFKFSRGAQTSSQARPSQLPIHVRIGRIEVRSTAAPAPSRSVASAAPQPLGFAAYARQRTYRNWPL